MLEIVIIEREPFPLLGIKTAISPAPDIEVSAKRQIEFLRLLASGLSGQLNLSADCG